MSGIYKVSALSKAGLAADWTAENLVLTAGEMGVETDSGKTKIGDGATAWTSLAYVGATSGSPAVTSVAGRTGAVVLAPADVVGLATVATSGSYADLSNKPTIPAAPATATTSAAGIVKAAVNMANVSGWTDTTAMANFNSLLAALRTAGLLI